MLLVVLPLLALLAPSLTRAQRNHEAEGMCQPFLTSNISSPLLPHIRRNLKIDEDGEFFCELVLQDRDLPGQVRVTIHEGLSYLAIRHVQMGLERHRDALRHLKILAELVPSNFNFQFRAGLWSLDPMIAEHEQAVMFLKEALYGKASEDEGVDKDMKLEARKHLAEALGYVGDFEASQKELLLILQESPLDFGVAFLLKEAVHQLKQVNIELSVDTVDAVQAALAPSEQFYTAISEHIDMKYTGFKIPSAGWTPRVYSGTMPSADVFEEHIAQREPFVVRREAVKSFRELLGWNVDQWSDMKYLREKVGSDENVMVERVLDRFSKSSKFGFGGGIYKAKMTFSSFLDQNFGENVKSEGTHDFLNQQDGYFREGIWNSPLDKLQEDIPLPQILASRAENISSVHLRMNNADAGISLSTRLHMDPMECLFAVVTGEKMFTLFSPDMTPSLRTVSPTYGVSPEGFSFQYNSPANLPHFHDSEVVGHEMGKGHYHFSALLKSIDGGSNVHLSEGDIIFIPAGWYHEESTAAGPSMAVNFRWLPASWRNTFSLEQEMKASLIEKLRLAASSKEL